MPRKNIRDLRGRPLISYTIKEAQRSSYIDKYIVSTDCKTTAKIAKEEGAEVPFLRPSDLSGDTATSASALVHAVEFLQRKGENYDYVVELMATNPLKKAFAIPSVEPY